MEDNFLMQLVREPAREGAPLDLLFTNRGLVRDVENRSCLEQSDHKMVEFSILGEVQVGLQENCYLGLPEGGLRTVQVVSRERPLGFIPERNPGKLVAPQEGSLKVA